jgi:hypothetical protein
MSKLLVGHLSSCLWGHVVSHQEMSGWVTPFDLDQQSHSQQLSDSSETPITKKCPRSLEMHEMTGLWSLS